MVLCQPSKCTCSASTQGDLCPKDAKKEKPLMEPVIITVVFALLLAAWFIRESKRMHLQATETQSQAAERMLRMRLESRERLAANQDTLESLKASVSAVQAACGAVQTDLNALKGTQAEQVTELYGHVKSILDQIEEIKRTQTEEKRKVEVLWTKHQMIDSSGSLKGRVR